ncbi:hypothetical protein QYE76_064596 [Lolium multiflorum]|uniref:Reverse transcriptase Ty1/copia-type domain-containing protein n=1 Tax=Lolium multiflorum TaxID=4521 RepID=A0AAD8S6S6_LOLMU|nr:hypothetical protein QYE76_064596 [Lolium multiflorum]
MTTLKLKSLSDEPRDLEFPIDDKIMLSTVGGSRRGSRTPLQPHALKTPTFEQPWHTALRGAAAPPGLGRPTPPAAGLSRGAHPRRARAAPMGPPPVFPPPLATVAADRRGPARHRPANRPRTGTRAPASPDRAAAPGVAAVAVAAVAWQRCGTGGANAAHPRSSPADTVRHGPPSQSVDRVVHAYSMPVPRAPTRASWGRVHPPHRTRATPAPPTARRLRDPASRPPVAPLMADSWRPSDDAPRSLPFCPPPRPRVSSAAPSLAPPPRCATPAAPAPVAAAARRLRLPPVRGASPPRRRAPDAPSPPAAAPSIAPATSRRPALLPAGRLRFCSPPVLAVPEPMLTRARAGVRRSFTRYPADQDVPAAPFTVASGQRNRYCRTTAAPSPPDRPSARRRDLAAAVRPLNRLRRLLFAKTTRSRCFARPDWRCHAEEYDAQPQQTGEPPRPRANVISGKWVFKHKLGPTCCTRRVSCVARASMDVSNAFLHGHLQEQVLANPSACDTERPMTCACSLVHVRTKQRRAVPRIAGFPHLGCFRSTRSASPFVYRTGHDMAYLLLYVDDIIPTASTAGLLRHLTDRLRAEFALKDLGPLHYFLGIEVVRRADGFFLHRKYAHELLERAGCLTQPCAYSCRHEGQALRRDGSPHPTRRSIAPLSVLFKI